MKRVLAFIVAAALILALTACGGSPVPENYNSDEVQLAAQPKADTIAVIKTTKGTIKLYLYPQYAEQTVANFVALANAEYYNGTEFHRVVEQLLVQAGDPSGTGTGGESATGAAVPNEFSSYLHNYYGAVGMASSATGENLSQFYIITSGKISEETAEKLRAAGYEEAVVDAYVNWGGAPHLDFRYTVFGQVYEGFDVLQKIAEGKVGNENYPEDPIEIISITIEKLS